MGNCSEGGQQTLKDMPSSTLWPARAVTQMLREAKARPGGTLHLPWEIPPLFGDQNQTRAAGSSGSKLGMVNGGQGNQLWATRGEGLQPKALRPNKDTRAHVLGGELVQPLEELVLHLQVLHDGLHHQVHAVDDGRRVCVGRYVAQGLLHKLTACLLPGKEGDSH